MTQFRRKQKKSGTRLGEPPVLSLQSLVCSLENQFGVLHCDDVVASRFSRCDCGSCTKRFFNLFNNVKKKKEEQSKNIPVYLSEAKPGPPQSRASILVLESPFNESPRSKSWSRLTVEVQRKSLLTCSSSSGQGFSRKAVARKVSSSRSDTSLLR